MDYDLAKLYCVSTKVLLQAVKRNIERFPHDFLFQLTQQEFRATTQILEDSEWGGRRNRPYAFTEHGAIMAATVLNSPRAIQASVYVVRGFVKLRQFVISHRELAQKLDEIERNVTIHDKAIRSLFDAIRQLMALPEKTSRKIGFDLNK
jgi:hypothetical protein